MLQETSRATAVWHRSGKGRLSSKWWSEYVIYPPAATPFLPGDEAIRQAVRTLPGARLKQIGRFADRDTITVQTRENIFRAHARKNERVLAQQFLVRIAEMALPERYVPPPVREACDAFMAECGMKSVHWNGRTVVAYSYGGYRFEAPCRWSGPHDAKLRRLARECSGFLPFYYEAAHT